MLLGQGHVLRDTAEGPLDALCEIGEGGLASGDRATEAAIACLDAEVPGWVASSGSAAAGRLDPLERRLARSPHGARRQPPGG